MAVSYGESIRGNGLFKAHEALLRLTEDPTRLDRERARFSRTPPYRPGPWSRVTTPEGLSPETRSRYCQTTSPSDGDLDGLELLRKERRSKIARDHIAFLPHEQYPRQVRELKDYLYELDINRIIDIPVGASPEQMALEKVKKLWVEQGIWNDKWNRFANGVWKHQKPLEPDSESEPDSEAGGPSSQLLFSKPKSKARPLRTDDDSRRIAERRVIRERQREASRPYHQFIFQISRERERLMRPKPQGQQDFNAVELGDAANAAATAAAVDAVSINTRAYENVKKTWIRRGIWNQKWGILPGMSWKHEEPVDFGEDAINDAALDPTKPPVNGDDHEAEAAPAVSDQHDQAPGVPNSSSQRRPANVGSVELNNGILAERGPSLPVSPASPDEGFHYPATWELSSPSATGYTLFNRAKYSPSPLHHPIHSSRVRKAAGKRKTARRRRKRLQEPASNGLPPSSSGVEAAEPEFSPPPTLEAPRRSTRLRQASSVPPPAQEPVKKVAKKAAKTASRTGPPASASKRAMRSKPEPKRASSPTTTTTTTTTTSFAKPQGVTKKRAAKTTRGKTRK
ncbi:hypothetical protein E4U54_005107 [Claviceps lovelessii]|nr:hypothetical protein E4U54_005107 [Claviceps lovelessii]